MTMWRIFILPLTLLCLTACGSGSGTSNKPGDSGGNTDDNVIRIDAAASRSSGVAPLGVFFNAGIDTADASFHNLEYSWDFGDPASGDWAATNSNKNSDKGPVAAHVFEAPGDYTVTLTTRDQNGTVNQQQIAITVDDPETVYTGTSTVCISRTASDDFTGCPSGAQHVLMDDIDQLPDHIAGGKRVLFRRGDYWETNGSASYANISGPVTIGAYGNCDNPDGRGICDNAPRIHLAGDETQGLFSLHKTSDWRIKDLHITGDLTRWGVIGGNTDLYAILLYRLRTEGFTTPLGNSHWDTNGHDQVMLVDSDVSETNGNSVYIGSERLVVMGNHLRNSHTTHVLRVWQAYMGVVSHNDISGASLNSDSGRHALKLHGPSQEVLSNAGDGRGGLVHPSRFIVIADNIFGSSGPWPVAIGPQDALHDERLRDILIEKNRFYAGYGDQSTTKVQISLNIWARQVTLRNNIFDGTGSSNYYTAVNISQRGTAPAPMDVRIYNNTIYQNGSFTGYSSHRGINIADAASQVIARNNLIHLPPGGTVAEMISNESADLIADHNLLTDTPGLTDPDNIDFLQKDFRLDDGSPAIDAGTPVPLLDDCEGNHRPQGAAYDMGAFER